MLYAQPMPVGTVLKTRDVPVHDPVMIKEGSTYYLFATGMGISVFSSTDLKSWTKQPPVFSEAPAWAVDAVPGYKGHTWAPDISYHNGQYYLYYSASAFGKNTSCIGLAVNKTLDPHSPHFKWVDLGKVIQSVPVRDQWNAIDPNLIVDDAHNPWLVFGSFWSGLKLVSLGDDFKTVTDRSTWYAVAARPRSATADTSAGNAAIEAPFIYKRAGYYYLFVSKDFCCRGPQSTYNVVVGRSTSVQGPYLDRNGLSLQQNGGTLVAEGDATDWFAVGHNAVVRDDDRDLLIMHGYDRNDKGRSKLIIRVLTWDAAGWPSLGENIK
jgi:arabinan endo-1,5-alpha-L-arabinosidase